MPIKQNEKLRDVQITVLGQNIREGRIFRMVKISIPEASSHKRKEILRRILDETKAIGLIEWWSHGSIIHKSKTNFCIIIVI